MNRTLLENKAKNNILGISFGVEDEDMEDTKPIVLCKYCTSADCIEFDKLTIYEAVGVCNLLIDSIKELVENNNKVEIQGQQKFNIGG